MYEVFSVVSGTLLLPASLLPDIRARDRFWFVVSGTSFIAYGIYVAHQTSGTFLFPSAIFIVPVAALVYAAATLGPRYLFPSGYRADPGYAESDAQNEPDANPAETTDGKDR
jgi:hypothetical protein